MEYKESHYDRIELEKKKKKKSILKSVNTFSKVQYH